MVIQERREVATIVVAAEHDGWIHDLIRILFVLFQSEYMYYWIMYFNDSFIHSKKWKVLILCLKSIMMITFHL